MLNKINIPVTSSQCLIHNSFKSSLHLHNNNKKKLPKYYKQ